jgi:hypothetical protein
VSAVAGRVANHVMVGSGPEHFHATFPGGVFAFGFDRFESTLTGPSGCNTACGGTNFSIEIFAGATSLGAFPCNDPNQTGSGPTAVGSSGADSDVAFDQLVMRDVTANSDNEKCASFLTGVTPLPPVSATGRSRGRVKILYR